MKLASVILLLLAPVLTSCQTLLLPIDCNDIYNSNNNLTSGVYNIYPLGIALPVYCDMDSRGGRWTVIQTRMDGTVNFYRAWDQYKAGFGSAAGEHWLGLENIHQLTRRKQYELLVDMEDFQGNKVFAHYTHFAVDAECDGYELHVAGFINGGAGDSLTYHSGQKFSTFDNDQDSWPENCARKFLGAFWYKTCHYANPNGIYRWGADASLYALGVEWYHWKGYNYSLKSISMKIRPAP